MSRPDPPPSWVINTYLDGASGETRVVVRRPTGEEIFPAEYGDFARQLNRNPAVLSASYAGEEGLRVRLDLARVTDVRPIVAALIAKYEAAPLAEVLEFRPRGRGPMRKRSG